MLYCQVDVPPSRFDDDSRNNSLDKMLVGGAEAGAGQGAGQGAGSRRRKESSCEWQGLTPGDDCDTYFLRNKLK